MGFRIVSGSPPPRTAWMPLDCTTATTLYVGQLVKLDSGSVSGLAPLADANGAADTTGAQKILGVVIGTNDFPGSENFLATYGQYSGITTAPQTVATQLAHKIMGAEGMHNKNDPAFMAEIAIIDPSTWLEGPFYNATVGVAPTLATVTTVNATMGLGFTTNAIDVATVANMCTAYCRTGANAGIYRIVKSASTTTHTFDTYWPYTIAVGDTFVFVTARQGDSFVNINTTTGYLGMGFDVAQTAATNYFLITVSDLDLREAGKEKCIFRFSPIHLTAAR